MIREGHFPAGYREMLNELTSDIRQQVEKGIYILKQGGVVAFPTDTVYGLGASVNSRQAVERVFRIKGRPGNMALPVLIAGTYQMTEVAEPVPQLAWLLARRLWPGALTMVLYKSERVPDIVTAGGRTVAIRVPAHPVPIAIIDGLGVPVIGTSANLSGRPAMLTADGVFSQLGDKIDLVIDGGRCPGGKESTIVDVTGEVPVILREGAIPKETIYKLCRNVLVRRG